MALEHSSPQKTSKLIMPVITAVLFGAGLLAPRFLDTKPKGTDPCKKLAKLVQELSPDEEAMQQLCTNELVTECLRKEKVCK